MYKIMITAEKASGIEENAWLVFRIRMSVIVKRYAIEIISDDVQVVEATNETRVWTFSYNHIQARGLQTAIEELAASFPSQPCLLSAYEDLSI